jgi:hypothetical protein
VQGDHVTIYRWIQRFTPILAEAAVTAINTVIPPVTMRPPDPSKSA